MEHGQINTRDETVPRKLSRREVFYLVGSIAINLIAASCSRNQPTNSPPTPITPADVQAHVASAPISTEPPDSVREASDPSEERIRQEQRIDFISTALALDWTEIPNEKSRVIERLALQSELDSFFASDFPRPTGTRYTWNGTQFIFHTYEEIKAVIELLEQIENKGKFRRIEHRQLASFGVIPSAGSPIEEPTWFQLSTGSYDFCPSPNPCIEPMTLEDYKNGTIYPVELSRLPVTGSDRTFGEIIDTNFTEMENGVYNCAYYGLFTLQQIYSRLSEIGTDENIQRMYQTVTGILMHLSLEPNWTSVQNFNEYMDILNATFSLGFIKQKLNLTDLVTQTDQIINTQEVKLLINPGGGTHVSFIFDYMDFENQISHPYILSYGKLGARGISVLKLTQESLPKWIGDFGESCIVYTLPENVQEQLRQTFLSPQNLITMNQRILSQNIVD